MTSLDNNLGSSCINNTFLSVNLRVWFQTENLFQQNHVDLMIMEANRPLILDLCLIENKTLSFIT
jgi:hypothetical protein